MKRNHTRWHWLKVLPIGVGVALLVLASLDSPDRIALGQKAWEAPAKAKEVKNPVSADEASLKKGKELFATNCAVCHGPTGAGDGMMAKNLNPTPAVIKERIPGQTDGEIFWKISEGKPPMPAFKATVPEKDRWSIVNYIRSL